MKYQSRVVMGVVLAAVLCGGPRAATPDTDERTALHVLNRVTFGPRPADIAHLQQVGVERFIDEQLHPERIADAALEARLYGFETLQLSSREIAARYAAPALRARRARQERADARPPDPPAALSGAVGPLRQRASLPLQELAAQKIVRAVYGQRQLEEVLTDFWFNHFNVDARKGPARFMLTEYERDVIRPHVLGRFRDLLGATATSPAMLFYLDNWMSADPGGPRPRAQTRSGGLNENYARELLELHTLGVDGGYTQQDVTDVARAFTGWTIQNPRLGGGYRFAAARHDAGEKTILGHRLAAGGGERDGNAVLDIVAAHPSTARFISTKLARRFVSDDPPASIVNRMAATFTRTDGDLRAVMSVLLTSPEFLARDAERAKVKNPFEFVVSALRATGADIQDARPLVRILQGLGMPAYQCQPPTGYTDRAGTWVNTGALVNRMNVALTLAAGKVPGVVVPDTTEASALVAGPLSDMTRQTIGKAAERAQAMALALGSPEFQRR
ncbi:MAG TPA: DUF1800 domain-containing protein [Vicinamibacterales bacterium]|nr:DUF1800 domain-containing protein [Vicinamibacterales bacterium]